MAGLNDIRTTFLDYFAKNDHAVVDSSPLVPRNDPTLMFTNAGMVQFKNVFTGQETRDYSRAATSQKCVRAGGKHNDLDNVGYTARHHTFFEMLGNFSFGDYFKEEAIHHAWTLITKDFDIPAEKLLVTVYHTDDEAFDLWKKIAGLTDDKIIRIPTSDNFWAMGDTGPCGPCSEIFFDHGPEIWGGPPGSPEEEGDRFIEIWNLVFMQYEQVTPEQRVDLPKPSIDTGMGLERIGALLQGKHNNYDTDLFRHLIENSAELTSTDPDGDMAASHKVIADHLRATSFLISDGVLPSNEGRGYVLRRIMRRAMRHAHLLGAKDPLMYRLVPALSSTMGQHYPELIRAQALITETLKLEEERFRVTLERGLRLLDEEVEKIGDSKEFPGEAAFKLYDTYGFPLDLTEDALRAKDIIVDNDGFNAAMERQKAEARKNWAGSGEAATDAVWFEIRESVGATEFLGYETERAEGAVVALVKSGEQVDTIEDGDEAILITNQTPFYGESGGQAGDSGTLRAENGASFTVKDTQKMAGDLFVHIGQLTGGSLNKGDALDMAVDHSQRTATRANHSATHLLHEALRRVLGDHVTQKGSLVNSERLRFDFSHTKAMNDDEISAVEDLVNAQILSNGEVKTRLMTPDAAVEAGALALFGEKYGDEVRVLSMGNMESGGKHYSTELCGGTHVSRLGDIGLLHIVSESAVAAGVRRVEALTGDGARAYLTEQEKKLRAAASVLKTAPADLPERIKALQDERKRLEKELGDAKKALAMGGGASSGDTTNDVREAGGVKFLAKAVEGLSPKDLRGMIDESKKQIGSGVIALIAVNEGKAAIAVGVTDDLTDRLNAVDLVKIGTAALGGKGGGGRPDMAQAGGPDGSKAEQALDAIQEAISG